MKPEQGEQGEFYKWVKASEDWERNLSGEMVRDKFNKWPIPYRSVTKSESFGNKFLRFWLSEFDIHTYQAENVEWLCKLSSPPPEDELWDEVENKNHVLCNQPSARQLLRILKRSYNLTKK